MNEVLSGGSENLVADAHASAVGRERGVRKPRYIRPPEPLLVLEVDGPEGDLLGELDVHAAAIGDVGVIVQDAAVLEVHPASANQEFGVGGGLPEAQPFDRQAGSDQVVVFADVEVGIETQPACLGFELNPASELQVHIGARAIEAVGAGFSDRSRGVVGLKS